MNCPCHLYPSKKRPRNRERRPAVKFIPVEKAGNRIQGQKPIWRLVLSNSAVTRAKPNNAPGAISPHGLKRTEAPESAPLVIPATRKRAVFILLCECVMAV